MSLRIRITVITTSLIFLLLGAFGAQGHVASAHAVAAPGSDEVLIAVDATPRDCTTRAMITQGTARYQTDKSPCLPGTVMGTEVVTQGLATANHQLYIALPSSDATTAQRETFQHDVAILVVREQEHLRGSATVTSLSRLSTRLRAMSPTYSCGWTVDSYMDSYLQNDFFELHLHYYVQSNCNTINFDESDVTLGSSNYTSLFWQRSSYNNPWWWKYTYYTYQWVTVPNHKFTNNMSGLWQSTESSGGEFYFDFCNYYCQAADTNAPQWSIDFGSVS